MTPMFVETLNSQAQEGVASQTAPMKGKLRATQTSLEFSQTQTTGAACSEPFLAAGWCAPVKAGEGVRSTLL